MLTFKFLGSNFRYAFLNELSFNLLRSPLLPGFISWLAGQNMWKILTTFDITLILILCITAAALLSCGFVWTLPWALIWSHHHHLMVTVPRKRGNCQIMKVNATQMNDGHGSVKFNLLTWNTVRHSGKAEKGNTNDKAALCQHWKKNVATLYQRSSYTCSNMFKVLWNGPHPHPHSPLHPHPDFPTPPPKKCRNKCHQDWWYERYCHQLLYCVCNIQICFKHWTLSPSSQSPWL